MKYREDYITGDQLFIGIAELASKRSKDPRSRHGACIVNSNNRVVSVGWNGLADGIEDTDEIWQRGIKDNYVIHSEINAILNATVSLVGCRLYMFSERGYYPCSAGCAQAIVQVGIKEVILKHITEEQEAKQKYIGEYTKKMFDAVGINIRILE